MGLNYDLGEKSENLRSMNCFENARFFEYYVSSIMAFKIGYSNMIWDDL